VTRDWTIVAAATGAASLVATAAGLPAPTVFAGLAVGMPFALSTGTRLASPRALIVAAQATIGVTLGAQLKPATLESVAGKWPLVGLVVVGTLLASLAAAHLVTTPGGIYAVLATAVGSGANTTFVLAVQTLRMVLMIVAAPPLVRLLSTGLR
jgi:uncharacterized protein